MHIVVVVVVVVMEDHHRVWVQDAVADYADVGHTITFEAAFGGSLAYGACYDAERFVLASVLERARLEVAIVPAAVGGQWWHVDQLHWDVAAYARDPSQCGIAALQHG